MKSFFGKFFEKKNQVTTNQVELLSAGLKKTRSNFFSRFLDLFSKKNLVAEEFLEEIEELLLTADVGLVTATKIVTAVQTQIQQKKPKESKEFYQILKEEITHILHQKSFSFQEFSDRKPEVVLVVGINGVGKTTSIAKLTHYYQKQNKTVILGAADTFRAAAVEQLGVWAERLSVPMIKQQQGADPSSVAFDTLKSAQAKKIDVAIIDTAGRLHNNQNLMRELEHIKKVIQKFDITAPHQVLLVLDATTGQNALEQAKEFSKATQVTGLILSKLDSSARGGVVLGIIDQLQIPIAYLGVGESVEDLVPFEIDVFLDLFFKEPERA